MSGRPCRSHVEHRLPELPLSCPPRSSPPTGFQPEPLATLLRNSRGYPQTITLPHTRNARRNILYG
jgi:hypothetical protein